MTEQQSQIKELFKDWENYLQNQDTIGNEILFYATSGLMFSVAYFKIRPISKFGKPSDIPKHFIKNRLQQNGKINAIEPSNSGPLLRINHQPPINLFFTSKKTLPVKLYGIKINSNGYSWLQTVTVNNTVKFIPIIRNDENAECQVFLVNQSSSNKPSLDLAQCLLSLGFAQVSGDPSIEKLDTNQEILNKYYKNLEKVQLKAKRNRSGMWSEIVSPPFWPITYMKKTATNAFYSLLKRNKPLPELVR